MSAETVNRVLENAPLPLLIEKLGVAIAEAQLGMDRQAIKALQFMADREENGVTLGDGRTRSMLDLGFLPSFYHFSGATIELRLSFSLLESKELSVDAKAEAKFYVFSASVGVHHATKYQFNATATSGIKATIVAVPPPESLKELIQTIKR